MIAHVVFWKFAEGVNHDVAAREIEDGLKALVSIVPGLLSVEVGKNVNGSPSAWDVSLRSVHDNLQALSTYQQHPEHKKIGVRIGELTAQRAVVDYHLD